MDLRVKKTKKFVKYIALREEMQEKIAFSFQNPGL